VFAACVPTLSSQIVKLLGNKHYFVEAGNSDAGSKKNSKSPILFSVHILHLTLRSGSVLPFSGMWCQTSQVDSNVEQLWLYDTEIYI
jgi:hypothetical protein